MKDAQDGDPVRFAGRVASSLDRLGAQRGLPTGWLVGGYLHGSAVLGGWHPEVSDVDLLVVVGDWPAAALDTVGDALAALLPRCPGRGLELSVVHERAAATPAEPWPFLLHVDSTGPAPRRVAGSELPGDPDLLLHYAVTRLHGLAVCGPPPAEVFGAVPRAAVLAALRDELDWAVDHGAGPYVVLNALRAMAYAQEGVLLSKVEAGRRALSADPGSDAVRRALRAQQGAQAASPPTDDDVALARQAQARLDAALHA